MPTSKSKLSTPSCGECKALLKVQLAAERQTSARLRAENSRLKAEVQAARAQSYNSWGRSGGRLIRSALAPPLPGALLAPVLTVTEKKRARVPRSSHATALICQVEHNVPAATASAAIRVLDYKDLQALILAFLGERDIVLCVSRINQAWNRAAPLALCWQHADIHKFSSKDQLNYLFYLGKVRPRLKSLEIRIGKRELFVLQWLLRICDTSELASVGITSQSSGLVLCGHSSTGVVIDLSSIEQVDVDHVGKVLASVHSHLTREFDVPVDFENLIDIDLLLIECRHVRTVRLARVGFADWDFPGDYLRVGMYDRNDVMRLGKLSNLNSLRINSIFALDLIQSFSNITDLTLFGEFCPPPLSLVYPQLQRLDFSEVSKGCWIKDLICPNLKELKVSIGRDSYGSGIAVHNAASPFPELNGEGGEDSLDPNLSLGELLELMVYPAYDDTDESTTWTRVNASVAPTFKLKAMDSQWGFL